MKEKIILKKRQAPHCQKCKVTEDLHKHGENKNTGYIAYMCRKCEADRAREYRKTTKGKKAIYKAVYKSIKKYPAKQHARYLLNIALKRGEIKKSKVCEECGISGKLESHHFDYNKPYFVAWLHRKCHINKYHK